MAISKKSLSDFEQRRLTQVLVTAAGDVTKVPNAVKEAMHGVRDPGARYRLKTALTQVAVRIIAANQRKAEGKPTPQRLKDLRVAARDALKNENFFSTRLTPDDD